MATILPASSIMSENATPERAAATPVPVDAAPPPKRKLGRPCKYIIDESAELTPHLRHIVRMREYHRKDFAANREEVLAKTCERSRTFRAKFKENVAKIAELEAALEAALAAARQG